VSKFIVTWVRISHLAEDIEVEAQTEEQAKKIANQLFTGGEEVYAEEFCNDIEEVEKEEQQKKDEWLRQTNKEIREGAV